MRWQIVPKLYRKGTISFIFRHVFGKVSCRLLVDLRYSSLQQ